MPLNLILMAKIVPFDQFEHSPAVIMEDLPHEIEIEDMTHGQHGENNHFQIINPHVTAVAEEVKGWKKLFFELDPFAEEQYVRDVTKFTHSNITFGVLFRMLVLAYWIYTIVEYFQSKDSTAYSQRPTAEMDPINITLTLQCNSKWGCYNWTTVSAAPHPWTNPAFFNNWKPITVSGQYNGVGKSLCGASNFKVEVRAPYAAEKITFQVH